MLLAAEAARPSADFGPVDFFAFRLLESILACVDMVILIPNLKMKRAHKSAPTVEKISVELPDPNHGFWILLILFGI